MTSDIDSLDDDFDLDEGFDLSDYEAKQGFSVVPAGTFDCEVVAVKPAKTAEGKRQVYFEYEVKAGEHEGSTFREYFAMDSDDGKSYLKGRFVSLGCDEGQGYHMSKPMPAAEFCDWVACWQVRAPARPGLAAELAIGAPLLH